jgi:hypothetical protein
VNRKKPAPSGDVAAEVQRWDDASWIAYRREILRLPPVREQLMKLARMRVDHPERFSAEYPGFLSEVGADRTA